MNATIVSINVGKPKKFQFKEREVSSAIDKKPVAEPVYLSFSNFAGDEQADLVFHGGKDKAVCAYSHDHYTYWENKLAIELMVGAFGENLTIQGVTEADICIGDVFRLGEAIVQVSQPRQPCYKLAGKHNIPDFVRQVQETGYTGFYFRVLQEGWVERNRGLKLIARDPAGVSLAYVNQSKYDEKASRAAIERILQVEALADSWRQSFAKRLAD